MKGKGSCPQRGNRYGGYDGKPRSETPIPTMRNDRWKAIEGLLFGATDFIPERDISVMLGEDVTSVQVELRRMELDGVAERKTLSYVPYKAKPGTSTLWRLKQAT